MSNTKTFTESRVHQLVVALLIVSNANNEQGLAVISGGTYGDKADNVLQAFKEFVVSDGSTNLSNLVSKIPRK